MPRMPHRRGCLPSTPASTTAALRSRASLPWPPPPQRPPAAALTTCRRRLTAARPRLLALAASTRAALHRRLTTVPIAAPLDMAPRRSPSTEPRATLSHARSGERYICFSKRRQGLFNKANDLSSLCGAMVGVVVISALGRFYSFGHPSTEAVMKCFFAPNPPNVLATSSDGANQDGGVDELQAFYKERQTIQGVIFRARSINQVLAEGASSSQQYLIGKPTT
ncbi:hypothetical protein EJB05_15815, partial [Eragrostis curvula]